MIQVMKILRASLEEELRIRHYVAKHLILLKPPKYDEYQQRLA